MGGGDQCGEVPAVDLEPQGVLLYHLTFDTGQSSLFIAENRVVAILFHVFSRNLPEAPLSRRIHEPLLGVRQPTAPSRICIPAGLLLRAGLA